MSLEQKIASSGNPAEMLRRAPVGQYVFPYDLEYTNWIEETRAWRESAVLLQQTFHMTDLYVRGPDTKAFLEHVAVNSFATWGKDKAKQIVCVSPDGYVIGDGILFGHSDEEALFVGRPPLSNWMRYQAEISDFDVTTEVDIRSLENPDKPRQLYRYEVQGPKALDILNEVNEGGPLVTKFFNMGEITVAGCKARTLSHGMGGAQGLELWGPYEDHQKVYDRLLEVGAKYGMLRAGSRAYSTASTESGWVAAPLPAIYAGEAMKGYREWLPDNGFEASCSVGGSFAPDDVSDYFFTPWDLDYGRVVKFDHDFIGRAALEKMATQDHRTKVTLVWSADSVHEVIDGMMGDFPAPKLMELPSAYYAAHQYEEVRLGQEQGDDLVGVGSYTVYSANERAWITLAMVRSDLAEPGTELELIWGEPDGGGSKPHVERHRQVRIKVEVQPWPIHKASRQTYRAQT